MTLSATITSEFVHKLRTNWMLVCESAFVGVWCVYVCGVCGMCVVCVCVRRPIDLIRPQL